MAVAEVDLTVSTAELTKEFACVCICVRLLCAVETMELAVEVREDSAVETREVVVFDRAEAVPLMALDVVVAAEETVETAEDAALAISPSPNAEAGQRSSQRQSKFIIIIFIPDLLVYSD
jgi:hypothetical protein